MEIKFDGGHDRGGKITAEVTSCDGCKQNRPCIVMDASQGEYKSGKICEECIEEMLAGLKPKGTN